MSYPVLFLFLLQKSFKFSKKHIEESTSSMVKVLLFLSILKDFLSSWVFEFVNTIRAFQIYKEILYLVGNLNLWLNPITKTTKMSTSQTKVLSQYSI